MCVIAAFTENFGKFLVFDFITIILFAFSRKPLKVGASKFLGNVAISETF